jgi:predicted RNase H-like HicB family nuclease
MSSFKTQVYEVDNKFICLIEELNLISQGNTLEEAFSLINNEKNEYLERMKDSNLSVPSGDKQIASSQSSEILSFIFKGLIVFFMSILLFVISGFVGGVAFKSGVDTVSEKVSSRTEKVKNLSDEEKVVLFRKKLNTFKPYLLEIKKALNE